VCEVVREKWKVLWFGEESSFIFGGGGGMLEDVECLFCEIEDIDITTDGWYANTMDPGCFEVGYEYILTRCYVMSVPFATILNKT
jgi:hypothetical protein